MIRNFEDFCRELNTCGFSMGGGNAKGIFALIDYDWQNISRVNLLRNLLICWKLWALSLRLGAIHGMT